MGNQYNRSYDNDRAPEPEQTLRTRLKYRVTVVKETLHDWGKGFRKLGSALKSRTDAREEAMRLREESGTAEEDSAAEEAAEIPESAVYGKDELTSENRAIADRIFSDVDERTGKKRKKITLTSHFRIYVLLWFVAFFATQALRSKASNIFFGFMTFLPVVLLLYALTAALALRVHMVSDGATVEKNDPYLYEMRLINQSFLPYPFIEARMILPQSNSVRSTVRSVFLSMAPFGDYDMKNEVRFRFRGTYHIGVDCFYVYDFFRIFAVRVDMQNAVSVQVLPRRLYIEDETVATQSDEPDLRTPRAAQIDKVEVGDIREYRLGDPLKSIHWNLSSRTEDLIVKDYNGGGTKTTYIYCDLSASFPEVPPELPAPTRAELKRARLEAQEKVESEQRKRKAILHAKKQGKTLSEEEISAAGRTARERKVARKAAKEEAKRKEQLSLLKRLEKNDPKKAALLRDRLYEADRREGMKAAEGAEADTTAAELDVQLLKDEAAYEDMNEYCADAVIELSIASAVRELRRGNEVVLIWYDRRSDSGICAYSFRSMGELQAIYPLFATAPLAPADRRVVKLSALAGDVSGVKQIFVTSAIDRAAVSAFCNMPSADGGTFGGSEILLYNPDEKFMYPQERRAYIEGCGTELASKGFRLALGTPGAPSVIGGDVR